MANSNLIMDNVSREKRSEIMSQIKSKNSKIEILFRKELWKLGFRYRKNSNKYFGKPDIVLPKYESVIFIDSCFWHGCARHCRMPSTHQEYWIQKISKNKLRDKKVSKHYIDQSWNVFRIWEHELKSNLEKTVKKINRHITK